MDRKVEKEKYVLVMEASNRLLYLRYTGAINNNKFKGKGTMIFRDGSKYTG